MNENLNLVEILKDCPKGTKLYSPIFGEVKFEEINDYNKKGKFTIVVYAFNLHLFANFTKRGFYFEGTGECTLFPSKEQRDWSKFTAPWYKKEKKIVKPKFKVGDKIVNRVNMYMGDLSHQCVISEITEDKYILNDDGYIYFKDQDIWELVHDKKQRFDPKTLVAFEKVLVRLTKDCIWNVTFFSHYDKEVKWGCYPCVTTSCKSYDKCIPYNDETKHLLGTSDEAPEYYRYWED